jgi:hypothetical protein
MNDLLKQLIEKEITIEDKINRTREFLQELMLKVLFDRGAFSHLAFTGGTALRVLYGLREEILTHPRDPYTRKLLASTLPV